MFHHDGNSIDYNIPPCCSQKYFRALFEHLHQHQDTTLFVQPDFDLSRLLERLVAHVPIADVTIAVPRLSSAVAVELATWLSAPCTDYDKDKGIVLKTRINNLTLITLPPQPKEDPKTRISTLDERPRRTLQRIFSKHANRVTLAESDISSTIILFRSKSLTIALYGDIAQHTSSHQNLRLLHASTNPMVCEEIARVLRIHSHKKVKP